MAPSKDPSKTLPLLLQSLHDPATGRTMQRLPEHHSMKPSPALTGRTCTALLLLSQGPRLGLGKRHNKDMCVECKVDAWTDVVITHKDGTHELKDKYKLFFWSRDKGACVFVCLCVCVFVCL